MMNIWQPQKQIFAIDAAREQKQWKKNVCMCKVFFSSFLVYFMFFFLTPSIDLKLCPIVMCSLSSHSQPCLPFCVCLSARVSASPSLLSPQFTAALLKSISLHLWAPHLSGVRWALLSSFSFCLLNVENLTLFSNRSDGAKTTVQTDGFFKTSLTEANISSRACLPLSDFIWRLAAHVPSFVINLNLFLHLFCWESW